MSKINVGLIREGKIPHDKRVALSPKQCKRVMELFPNVEIYVQKSPIRCFPDEMYKNEGINLVDSLENCSIIIGVKEVEVADLLPNRTFLFFSHTYKKQIYNRKLLKAILDKKIQLIDYELLKCKKHKRIIGFGRYAGVVGCFNGFRTYGVKHKLYDLKPAHKCFDRKEMEAELVKIQLPKDFKLVLTGHGRVGHGAREILELLPIQEVSPEEFLSNKADGPVFTHIDASQYNKRIDGGTFDKEDFYNFPEKYCADFYRFAKVANMYIPCHFWASNSPKILTQQDLMSAENNISVIADVSCDISGPIASTVRASTIDSPFYGYNPKTDMEDDYSKEGVIAVMAVDNLPCELPKDASHDFGETLIEKVFPLLFGNDPDNILIRASETNLKGELMPDFAYLASFVNSELVQP